MILLRDVCAKVECPRIFDLVPHPPCGHLLPLEETGEGFSFNQPSPALGAGEGARRADEGAFSTPRTAPRRARIERHTVSLPLIRRCAPPSPTRGEGISTASSRFFGLLPLWEKVPEGRMRGRDAKHRASAATKRSSAGPAASRRTDRRRQKPTRRAQSGESHSC